MKLIAKYNRVNIFATVVVLLMASVCYFAIVRYVLIHQLDNTLKVEEEEILNYVKSNHQLPAPTDYRDQHIHFEEVTHLVSRAFTDIQVITGRGQRATLCRELSFPVDIEGRHFRASVTKSQEETRNLVQLIVLITIGVIVLLLLILFVANRLMLRRLWEPFYSTLESIQQFNFSNHRQVPPQSTGIDEFKELQAAVTSMQARISRDFEALKRFSDNASHEMQTPLAILNSKLDLLIQEPGWSESQTRQLQSMYDALGRLSKLNQSLLLLTKIENNQFHLARPLRLDVLVRGKLNQLDDLVAARQLHVSTDLKATTVHMNDYLVDILLNNLLSNAIRHNEDHGTLGILLNGGELKIDNTGPALGFEGRDVFERFKKGDNAEGIGLGLAIVKQICDYYGFRVDYTFRAPVHEFTIFFTGRQQDRPIPPASI